MANQVAHLREEVTALLSIANADRGDRVIIQLNSGGGTVTGYGLGAAQILRLKDAGLHVTVTVDEVAASGGYLMASVADRIVASPFALLGSVGVVATMPNFSERLTREGVIVEDVTAGKYKRTMTPYKKTTDEDRAKLKSDVEQILVIFKDWLKTHRPQLNVEAIATGETWHGPDAVKKGLVDSLITTDDLILQCRDDGYEVYSLCVKAVIPTFAESYSEAESSLVNMVKGVFYRAMASIMRDMVAKEGGMADNLTTNDWTRVMNNDVSGVDQSTLLQQRIMAIDPNLPPRS